MPSKTYVGRRVGQSVAVTVDGKSLDPRYDLFNFNQTGFEWGYGGNGSSQLALALLADHFDDGEKAFGFYEHFKWAVIVKLPKEGWSLTSSQVEQALSGVRPKPMSGRA